MGLKEGLVKCETVCVKSEVILKTTATTTATAAAAGIAAKGHQPPRRTLVQRSRRVAQTGQ